MRTAMHLSEFELLLLLTLVGIIWKADSNVCIERFPNYVMETQLESKLTL